MWVIRRNDCQNLSLSLAHCFAPKLGLIKKSGGKDKKARERATDTEKTQRTTTTTNDASANKMPNRGTNSQGNTYNTPGGTNR